MTEGASWHLTKIDYSALDEALVLDFEVSKGKTVVGYVRQRCLRGSEIGNPEEVEIQNAAKNLSLGKIELKLRPLLEERADAGNHRGLASEKSKKAQKKKKKEH